jgi:hypothetical protein
VGVLLFVAFAFFAFAQAASVRNGAQTAADAAALAAAQEGRQELMRGLLGADPGVDEWGQWLDGGNLTGEGAAEAADRLADRNRSRVIGFSRTAVDGAPGFKVTVETNYTTGSSLVPGAADRRAKASATAVLRPQCAVMEEGKDLELDCGADTTVRFPVAELEDLAFPEPSKMFEVHLAG